jgi:hypothetical protein
MNIQETETTNESETTGLLSGGSGKVLLNKPGHEAAKDGLGGKNIGTYGSFVYIINQIFGPGMVAIPIVLQQGKIPVLPVLYITIEQPPITQDVLLSKELYYLYYNFQCLRKM